MALSTVLPKDKFTVIEVCNPSLTSCSWPVHKLRKVQSMNYSIAPPPHTHPCSLITTLLSMRSKMPSWLWQEAGQSLVCLLTENSSVSHIGSNMHSPRSALLNQHAKWSLCVCVWSYLMGHSDGYTRLLLKPFAEGGGDDTARLAQSGELKTMLVAAGVLWLSCRSQGAVFPPPYRKWILFDSFAIILLICNFLDKRGRSDYPPNTGWD